MQYLRGGLVRTELLTYPERLYLRWQSGQPLPKDLTNGSGLFFDLPVDLALFLAAIHEGVSGG
jgi:hypothetical protein